MINRKQRRHRNNPRRPFRPAAESTHDQQPQPTPRIPLRVESDSDPHTVHRRRYKVDSLPEGAQALIFEGFISGTPYRRISEQLNARGIQISRQALCRYWRECWQKEFEFLRHARTCVLLIARALKQDPDGDLARIGRELLYTMVLQKAPFLRATDPLTLLHEALAIDKASHKREKATASPPSASSLSDNELDRKIREIYGIPEPVEPFEKQPNPHAEEPKN